LTLFARREEQTDVALVLGADASSLSESPAE
jgi:hypothetical protein